MLTYQEVVDDAKARREFIIGKEKEINRQLALTNVDDEVERLTAMELEYIESRQMLDLMTLQSLDKSAELANIKATIVAVIAKLRATQRKVEKWGAIADGVTEALTQLDALTKKLAELKPKDGTGTG
jgi:hypothetical protein